jgi:hypothetical protein
VNKLRLFSLGEERLLGDGLLSARERRLAGLPKDAPTYEDLRRSDDLRGGRRKMKGR